MAAAALLVAAALLGHANAGIVELSCSDNATCIENMAREFVRSIRQQKTVRVFDALTVEPLGVRQARSNEGPLVSFLKNHAFTFDWNDYTVKLWKAQDRKDVLDLEVYEGRTAKDVPEEVPKKSKSKVEEEEEVIDDKKSPKRRGIIRRRSKKKIMQAVIPMVFGMKSAAAVMLAMGVVTVLVMKAFIASKLALMVTIGMAVKRLYESYSLGAGLQNHPYLYSQYPIDFPSASSHAYSVSGVSPQFQEMYNGGLTAQAQADQFQQDASAQQSQQAPSVQLLNSTRASERWDGKSLLQKLIEPIFEGVKSYLDPLKNLFYSMPATFRGLTSDVTTMKTSSSDIEEEKSVKKPREILVAQPRLRAQRKMTYRGKRMTTPKKYTELKVDLEKLKNNKDLHDYVKTKKYKHNYQNTYYYPRIKYFVNPNTFVAIPKNSRLIPYKKDAATNRTQSFGINTTKPTWKPTVYMPVINFTVPEVNKNNPSVNKTFHSSNRKSFRRVKRSLGFDTSQELKPPSFECLMKFSRGFTGISGRGFMKFLETLADADPVNAMMKQASKYTKSVIKHSLKSAAPPKYYTVAYELIMMSLDVIDGLVQVHQALIDYFVVDGHKSKKKSSLAQGNLNSHKKPAKPLSHKQKQKQRKKKPGTFQNQQLGPQVHDSNEKGGDDDDVESHKDIINEDSKENKDSQENDEEDSQENNEEASQENNEEDSQENNEEDGQENNEEDIQDNTEKDNKEGNEEDSKKGNEEDSEEDNEEDIREGNEEDSKEGKEEDKVTDSKRASINYVSRLEKREDRSKSRHSSRNSLFRKIINNEEECQTWIQSNYLRILLLDTAFWVIENVADSIG